MTEIKGLEYLDFSLDILRRLPSKKVNWKQYSEDLLERYRNTTEETNTVVNGFEIARGLTALGIVSDGKTHKEILKLLNYACFRNKSASKSLEECLENIQMLMDAKNTKSTNKQVIRMFFEQRDVTPFDKEIIKKLDEIFLEKLPPGNHQSEDKHVLRECNFVCDPSGRITKSKIDAEIYNATEKTIKKVIRTDLLPNWRARFLLTIASDENFQLKYETPPESVIGYFYDSFDHQNKSWCSFVKVKIFARIYEAPDCSVYEISTTNESETLVIILPKTEKLSYKFLPKLTAARISELIKNFNGIFIEKEAIIPKIAIPGSFGLRSILNNKISFFSSFFRASDPFLCSRIFCPFKAEFSKIIGKKIEACLVFPLFEFYCKFRCNMQFENVEEEAAAQNPPSLPPPVSTQQNAQPNQTPSATTQSTDNRMSAGTDNAEKQKSGSLDSKKVLSSNSNKNQLADVPETAKESHVRSSVPPEPRPNNNGRTTQNSGDNNAGSSSKPSNDAKKEPPKRNLNESIYKPPKIIPFATFEHSITIEDEISGSFKHDPLRHPRNKDVNNGEDSEFHLNAEITLTHPFLFMIVSKITANNKEFRFPKFIGRFTNVEEIFDESWTKE